MTPSFSSVTRVSWQIECRSLMSLLTTGQAVAGYQGVDALFRTIVELSDGLLSRAHFEHPPMTRRTVELAGPTFNGLPAQSQQRMPLVSDSPSIGVASSLKSGTSAVCCYSGRDSKGMYGERIDGESRIQSIYRPRRVILAKQHFRPGKETEKCGVSCMTLQGDKASQSPAVEPRRRCWSSDGTAKLCDRCWERQLSAELISPATFHGFDSGSERPSLQGSADDADE